MVTDLVVWHLGWGMQLTPPGAFGIARKVRRKAPGLYPPNARNIPDTVQRLHWDPERAQELGIPMSYDYGAMRETWLTHALTDWMGDDGWLLRLRCEHRKFNYIGDTTWVRGKVVDKVQADGRNEVHLEVGCWNQRGEQTTPGTRGGAAADPGARGRAARAARRLPGGAARGRDRAPRVNQSDEPDVIREPRWTSS